VSKFQCKTPQANNPAKQENDPERKKTGCPKPYWWIMVNDGDCDHDIQRFSFSSVQSLSCVLLFVTPWIAARQASLSITNSRSSLRLTSIKSVMPSSHLILCRPLLLLPPIPPRQVHFYLCHQESYLLHSVDVRREKSISAILIIVSPPHSTGQNEEKVLNKYCLNTWINGIAYDS